MVGFLGTYLACVHAISYLLTVLLMLLVLLVSHAVQRSHWAWFNVTEIFFFWQDQKRNKHEQELRWKATVTPAPWEALGSAL